MPTYTLDLSEAEEQLSLYLEASRKIASGQSYNMGTVSLTRANLPEVRQAIAHWTREVNKFKALAQAGTDDYATRNPGVALARVR